MRRPHSRPAKFAISLGLLLSAVAVGGIVPFLDLPGDWPDRAPTVAVCAAMALCAWTVRLRHVPIVAAVLTAAFLMVITMEIGRKTALSWYGRETTAVVMDIGGDGREYRLVEVGSLDDLGVWEGPDGYLGPGERVQVLVGTGHARGPEPFDVVTDIVGESIVAGFLLPLTGFLCWLAAGKRRVKKPRAFSGPPHID